MNAVIRRIVKRATLLRAREGSVAVEFALVSSVALALMAGMLDVSQMIGVGRDAERASALMTKTITSCPPPKSVATWTGTDCVNKTMKFLIDRTPSILVSYPTAMSTVGIASFQRVSGAIRMCPGNMTFLESDMQTSALASLKDDDAGALTYIKFAYTPFLPVLSTFANATNTAFRQYTLDVRGNGPNFACAT